MAVSEGFRTFALDQLGRVATGIRARSMFGGVGVYSRDFFFALLDDDRLYLKVNDSNRSDFEARGLEPFRPGGGSEVMQYYELSGDILEDIEQLAPWVEKAIKVAQAKSRPRRKR